MDFSAGRKFSYLVALRLALESNMFSWPHAVTGLGLQLGNYDPYKDKAVQSKLPQDLVATIAMAAFAISTQYSFYEGGDPEDQEEDSRVAALRRSGGRSRVGGSRSEPTRSSR